MPDVKVPEIQDAIKCDVVGPGTTGLQEVWLEPGSTLFAMQFKHESLPVEANYYRVSAEGLPLQALEDDDLINDGDKIFWIGRDSAVHAVPGVTEGADVVTVISDEAVTVKIDDQEMELQPGDDATFIVPTGPAPRPSIYDVMTAPEAAGHAPTHTMGLDGVIHDGDPATMGLADLIEEAEVEADLDEYDKEDDILIGLDRPRGAVEDEWLVGVGPPIHTTERTYLITFTELRYQPNSGAIRPDDETTSGLYRTFVTVDEPALHELDIMGLEDDLMNQYGQVQIVNIIPLPVG